jgi:hypothetical protein
MRNVLAASELIAGGRRFSLLRDMQAIIASALKSAAPIAGRDLVHWGDCTSRAHHETSISKLFRSLLNAATDDPEMPNRIDRVLRRVSSTPSVRTVKRYCKLRRKLRSSALAAWLTWPSAYWPLR